MYHYCHLRAAASSRCTAPVWGKQCKLAVVLPCLSSGRIWCLLLTWNGIVLQEVQREGRRTWQGPQGKESTVGNWALISFYANSRHTAECKTNKNKGFPQIWCTGAETCSTSQNLGVRTYSSTEKSQPDKRFMRFIPFSSKTLFLFSVRCNLLL